MCCDSDDKTIDSPIVKAAVYTAWGLPFLGLAVHGIWGAIGAAAAVGIIATSAPKWMKNNFLGKIEQRWLAQRKVRIAEMNKRAEQERLQRIEDYRKKIEHPTTFALVVRRVGPWIFSISFWLWPAAVVLSCPFQGALISSSWISMILTIICFANADVDYDSHLLQAELKRRQPEIKIETFAEIANNLETWKQRYPVFIACSVLAAISAIFVT
jgi:hypothetical protein